MAIGRISTFTTTSTLLKSAMSTQSLLSQTQAAQTSGKKSLTWSGLSREASSYLSYANELATLSSASNAAGQASSRLSQTYSLIGNISDLAESVRTSIASWQSSSGNTTDIAARAKEWLNDLQALLNTKSGGQYLLSGDSEDIAPVDFSTLGPADASTFDTSYYHGSSSGQIVRLGEGSCQLASVQANDPAIETLVRSLSLLAQSSTPADVLSDAFNLATTAIKDLGQLQETVSVRTQSVESYITRLTARSDTLGELTSALTDADLAEATLLATQYETQLKAVYSSLADTMRLSLLDYL